MRIVVLVGLLALSGCTSDQAGDAFGAFARGFEGTSRNMQPLPPAPAPIPMQPQPGYAPPPAAQAFFTGRSQQVQSVTGRTVWECQYNFNGQVFVRLFEAFCPPSTGVM